MIARYHLDYPVDRGPDVCANLTIWAAVSPGIVEFAAITCEGVRWDGELTGAEIEELQELALRCADLDNFDRSEWGPGDLAALRPAKEVRDAAA